MKQCCKTGNNNSPNHLRRWLNYVIYAVIAIIVVGALLLQLFGEK
jgi:disulfide bond formation protein DsbB